MTINKRKYLIDCDINTKSKQELEFYLIKTEPEEKVVVCTDNKDLYSVTVNINDKNVPLFIMELKKLFHSWKNKNCKKEKKILSDLDVLGNDICIYKIENSIEVETENLFNDAKIKNETNIEFTIKQKRLWVILSAFLLTNAIMAFIIYPWN